MNNCINICFKNDNIYLKSIIVIIFYFFMKFYKNIDFYKEITIENKLSRYIKYKKKENIIKKNYEKEIPNIKNYIRLLRKRYIKNEIFLHNISKPKVSFIASVYNKEKYLYSFITSIQKQNLKDYELIMVDDCSNDKSVEIIKNLQKLDNRIYLMENKKNMGSLFTRYKGAIYAKGEYIIFVDSDDIILKEGISNAYNYIKKNNLDMVEFNSVFERNNTTTYISRRYYKYTNIIYQPILSYIFFYKRNSGYEFNSALWDKLIKRKVVIESLKYIGKEFLNKKIIIENDVIILFALFRNSNSFQYIDELGYYYSFENKDSITNTRDEPLRANQIIYSIFCNIGFLYYKTGNTFLDKYFCLFKLKQGYNRYKKCFSNVNKNTLRLVSQVLNKLLRSKYISSKNKLIISNISKNIFINKNYYKNHRFIF